MVFIRRRSWPVLLMVGFCLIEAVLLLQPIRNGITRRTILLFGFLCCVMLVVTVWRLRVVRWTVAALVAGVVIFLLLPGSADIDRTALRAQVVRSLLSYEGTTYVWGGENHWGIDCSGLVRHGIIDAALSQGVKTFNPTLVRMGLSMWWHDCSARELDQGYGGRAEHVAEADRVADVDDTMLRPGDFCVTADGCHTMAYIGQRRWIEADPTPMRVIQLGPGAVSSYYTSTKVHLLRWTALR